MFFFTCRRARTRGSTRAKASAVHFTRTGLLDCSVVTPRRYFVDCARSGWSSSEGKCTLRDCRCVPCLPPARAAARRARASRLSARPGPARRQVLLPVCAGQEGPAGQDLARGPHGREEGAQGAGRRHQHSRVDPAHREPLGTPAPVPARRPHRGETPSATVARVLCGLRQAQPGLPARAGGRADLRAPVRTHASCFPPRCRWRCACPAT